MATENSKEVLQIKVGKLKRASDKNRDEYATNILDQENRLIAKTIFSPYYDPEEAEALAEIICKAVNERQKLIDTLKECAEFLKEVKRMYDDVNPVGGWQYIDDGSQMYLEQINKLLKS